MNIWSKFSVVLFISVAARQGAMKAFVHILGIFVTTLALVMPCLCDHDAQQSALADVSESEGPCHHCPSSNADAADGDIPDDEASSCAHCGDDTYISSAALETREFGGVGGKPPEIWEIEHAEGLRWFVRANRAARAPPPRSGPPLEIRRVASESRRRAQVQVWRC